MKQSLLPLLAVVLGGCAGADRESMEAVRSESPQAGLISVAGPVDVSVDTGSRPLGAYTVTLLYDSALVRVLAVEPSSTFRLPDFGERGLVSGELVLSAYQLRQNPTGITVVARVSFESLGGGESALRIRLVNLYDPEGIPVEGKAAVSRDRVP